jgi:hypothetical protein
VLRDGRGGHRLYDLDCVTSVLVAIATHLFPENELEYRRCPQEGNAALKQRKNAVAALEELRVRARRRSMPEHLASEQVD